MTKSSQFLVSFYWFCLENKLTWNDLPVYHSSQHTFPLTKNGTKSQLPSFLSPQRNEKKNFRPLFILPLTKILKLIPPSWCFQNYFQLKNASDGGNITYPLLIEYDIQKYHILSILPLLSPLILKNFSYPQILLSSKIKSPFTKRWRRERRKPLCLLFVYSNIIITLVLLLKISLCILVLIVDTW